MITAIAITVLVAFTGFAVDVGMLYAERRQDQSAADAAALAGGRAVWRGQSNLEIFSEVAIASWDNLPPTTRPDGLEWMKSFYPPGTFPGVDGCTDPDAAAAGYPVALAGPWGSTGCIHVDQWPGATKIRVKTPDTTVDTFFANLVGVSSFQVNAFAEAGRITPDWQIFPSAVSYVGNESAASVCLGNPPPGHANEDCEGPTSGNFGIVELVRPTMSTNQNCNGGHSSVIIANMAFGADHMMATAPDAGPSADLSKGNLSDDPGHETYVCPVPSLPWNVRMQTGSSAASNVEEGLLSTSSILGVSPGGRLVRSPLSGTTVTVPWNGGITADDTPMWEFFDDSLVPGDDRSVTCSGTPGFCAEGSDGIETGLVPVTCWPELYDGSANNVVQARNMLDPITDSALPNVGAPLADPTNRGAVVSLMVDQTGAFTGDGSRELLQQCFHDYSYGHFWPHMEESPSNPTGYDLSDPCSGTDLTRVDLNAIDWNGDGIVGNGDGECSEEEFLDVRYHTDLFTLDGDGDGEYDIQSHRRFAWVPESWGDLSYCSGSNCYWNIRRFRPVYLQTLYWDKGASIYLWSAGEPIVSDDDGDAFTGDECEVGSGGCDASIPNSATLRSLQAFLYDEEMVPQEIIDEGPGQIPDQIFLLR